MEHTKTYLDYKKKANEKFVRYDEGAEMYHMGISKFMQIAKDAKACYKVGQMVLVKLEIIDEYLETFRIVDAVCDKFILYLPYLILRHLAD